MSTLYVVRHGQASFGASNYDVLSPLGADQSRCLGAFWAERGVTIDAIYSGPRERHKDTAAGIREGAGSGGLDIADPIELAALDEYPALPLFRTWLPKLAERDPQFKELTTGGLSASTSQRLLESVSAMWAAGELDTGEFETFAEFVGRVDGAIDQIMRDQGRGKSVAVVTSGGPVSATVRRCLELSPHKTMQIAWVTANASITEFRYRGSGDDLDLGLIGLNRIPHLSQPRLVTYR